MEGKNLVLFVVVALVALFIISSFSGRDELTGKSIGRGGTDSCTDSDGGINLDKGTVTVIFRGTERAYSDRCSGGGGLRVLENYCDGNRRAFTYEWCPNGMICSDGTCINDATTSYYGD